MQREHKHTRSDTRRNKHAASSTYKHDRSPTQRWMTLRHFFIRDVRGLHDLHDARDLHCHAACVSYTTIDDPRYTKHIPEKRVRKHSCINVTEFKQSLSVWIIAQAICGLKKYYLSSNISVGHIMPTSFTTCCNMNLQSCWWMHAGNSLGSLKAQLFLASALSARLISAHLKHREPIWTCDFWEI